MTPQLGKLLIIAGILIVILGLIILFADRIPFLGKLPGDLTWEKGNTRVYIPITSMILISIILTIVLNLFSRK